MKKITFKFFIFSCALLFSFSTKAQTCNGNTFTYPGAPSSCTYTYTASGWDTVPPTSISSGESVCILADLNTTDFADIDGIIYVAPNVTYTGNIGTMETALIEGTLDLTSTLGLSNTLFYITDTGTLNIPGNSHFSGASVVHNAGTFNIGNNLKFSGSSFIVNYPGSHLTVQNEAELTGSAGVINCGLFEVLSGALHTSGSTGLQNECTTYVHNDVEMSSDYINNGVFIVDGTINLDGNTLYNNNLLIVDNLVVDGDDIIGNNDTSILVIKNNAELIGGASITGHYYFDMDDGGGFDSVCGSCTEDINVLLSVTIPTLVEDLTVDCGINIVIESPQPSATIDFDGVDDYIDSNTDLSGFTKATVMTWVKLDPAFSNTGRVINQGDFNIQVNVDKTITVELNNAAVTLPNVLNLNEWIHITTTYDASLPSSKLKVFINGELLITNNDTSLLTGINSSTDLFTIGKSSLTNTNYFKGDIDEVRLFDIALTNDQMYKIIYQEIEESYASVSGLTIPKTILDHNTNATIPWTNLRGYYPMTNIISLEKTEDFSSYNNTATLHNITTLQEQTAPMPFTTSIDGSLEVSTTFTHGDVWDITNLTDLEWAILKVQNNVTIKNDLKTAGLIIDSDKTLEVLHNNLVKDRWYLELNGTLDLKNDSQLIQTKNSDLVTSSDGGVLRRQEGQNSVYRYNYWSAPVGVKQATSYVDNNDAFTNNPNNTPFTLSMLKDASGNAVQFTNGYHEDGKISTYWLYSFQNGVTYYDWDQVGLNTPLIAGLGYTQKGGGSLSDYTFEGKPNNGTIFLSATDTGGSGSVGGVSKTEYLVGNPYPSAIDAHQFIQDNSSVINGEIYLWEQWSGNSHVLNNYEGGYATLNLLGAVNAYQFVGLNGANNGSQDGILTPKRYLPVGQGFMVEVVSTGNIQFNNNQRIFRTEASGQSQFFKVQNDQNATDQDAITDLKKIRLEFKTENDLGRQLLLGFSSATTDAFDYGYDAKVYELNTNDLTMPLNNDNTVIQAFSQITSDKVVDLNFKATGSTSYSIKAIELENIEATQEVYLLDNLTGIYFDLTTNQDYTFTSDSGTFNDRFDIVFQDEAAALSIEDYNFDATTIYFNSNQETLFVKGLKEEVKTVTLYNTLGQNIYNTTSVTNQQLENGLQISNLSTGMYVVSIKTENNQTIDKKIILK